MFVNLWEHWGSQAVPRKSASCCPTRSDSEGLRDWMLLNRPREACGYSGFWPGIWCRPESLRYPKKGTAVKIMQSSSCSLMETAARLRFFRAIRGITYRQVFLLSFPLATQHGRMVNFSPSRVTSGTRSSKNCKQVFSRQLPLS